MNVFRSKTLALAAAGFGAALCMTTAIGQAQVEVPYGFSDLVAFHGTATITGNTGQGTVPDSCSGNFVCGVGGTGTYTFSSDLCVGVSDGPEVGISPAPPPPVPGLGPCAVSATGPFQNIVCGTGSAQGTASITEADEVDSVSFGIIFVAGLGVTAGNGGPSIGDSGVGPVPAPSEDFVGVVILIAGPMGTATANQCVSGFGILSADVALDLPVAVPPLPPIA